MPGFPRSSAAVSRTLYVLRHAKSSWAGSALPDHERPLARRGRRACKLIAAYMRQEGVEPDLVLCSSSVRTRQTLDGIAKALPASTEVRVDGSLYGATAEGLLAIVHSLPDSLDSALLIGHDPGMHDLTLALARPGALRDEVRPKFPTAALATLTLTTSWAAVATGTADLTAFVTPRGLSGPSA
jgi:phosphohistidine phosphatase